MSTPIDKPDVNNTDPAYWEKVLKSHKLSMERGRSRRISFIGGWRELEQAADAIRANWIKETSGSGTTIDWDAVAEDMRKEWFDPPGEKE